MKTILLIVCILAVAFSNAQDEISGYKKEKVNWESLPTYTVEKISFETTEMKYDCSHCRCMDITSASGVTGILIAGNAVINFKNKKKSDTTEVCLFRFNPSELKKYVTTSGRAELKDRAFSSLCRALLTEAFRTSFHSDMDALIPHEGEYTTNSFGKAYGDVLATSYNNTFKVLNTHTGEDIK